MKKVLKRMGKVLLLVVLVVALLLCGAGVYYGASRRCAVTVKVDTAAEKQMFDGWGASACWWADDIEDEQTRNEVAALLYGDDGLKLNVYRYNIGGGYDENHNAVTNPWRLNESFYYYDESDGSYKYDFSRDANAQAMLQACLAQKNVDSVILFANSPHYSMCTNGMSSGNGSSNLAAENYQNYVDYFLEITQYFIDQGVPVHYISPINEPQWGWGGDQPTQEGCHYEPEGVEKIFEAFSKGITQRGMQVQLYGPESANIGDTTKNYYGLLSGNDTVMQHLGVFSYHSYFSDGDYFKKKRFGDWREKNVSDQLRFEMSEWCELPTQYATTDVRSALVMARVISQDIGATGVSAWSAWVAMNENGIKEDGLNYSDGLLVADPTDASKYEIAYRYYALKQFSAFVPAGSVVLDASENVFTPAFSKDDEGVHISKLINSVAFRTPEDKIVLVVVNEGRSRTMRLSVGDYSQMMVYTTDEKQKCVQTYSGAAEEKVTLGANSINTYIFEG